MDLWLKAPSGHVIGFTLPLHPTIERQWRDGTLQRVHEDGTPYEDPFDGLLAAGGVAVASGGGEPSGQPGTEPDSDADGPVAPLHAAPKADWLAYAQALGLHPDPKTTKADLIALTTPPELAPGDVEA